MDRRRFLRRAVPVVAVGLAGCTGDQSTPTPTEAGGATDPPTATDSPTATATGTPTDPATSTASPTDPATSTASPTPTGTPTPQPDATVTVAPEGALRFEPASFEIAAGDTVLWEWASGGHNVSPASQPSGASWPGEDEEFGYPEGHTHAYTFEVPGTYEYHCDPHQGAGMVGSFTVE